MCKRGVDFTDMKNTIDLSEILPAFILKGADITRIDDALSAVYFPETNVVKVYDRDSNGVVAHYIRIMDRAHAARVLAEIFPCLR